MTDSGHLAQLCDFISTYGLHGAVVRKDWGKLITVSLSCSNKVSSGGSAARHKCRLEQRPASSSSCQFSVRSGKRGTKWAAAPFRLPLQVRARGGCNKSLTARPDLPEFTVKAYKVAQITESD